MAIKHLIGRAARLGGKSDGECLNRAILIEFLSASSSLDGFGGFALFAIVR